MTRIGFLIFAITLSVSGVEQKILILKSGEKVEFKKWKLYKEHIRILHNGSEKSEIDINEIDGYFDPSLSKRYYKKPAPPDIFATKKRLTYEFVERIVEGKINLYESIQYKGSHITTPGGSMMPSADVDYYIEKNDDYRWVFTGKWQKAETLDVLKKLLGDDETLVGKLNAANFKINLKTITQLIREYNVRAFAGVASGSYQEAGSVGFYARIIGKKMYDILLKVNDSLTYQVPDNNVLNVRLPVSTRSKVCFVAGSAELCNVISASPFMMTHYELEVNMKDLVMELNLKDLSRFSCIYMKRITNDQIAAKIINGERLSLK